MLVLYFYLIAGATEVGSGQWVWNEIACRSKPSALHPCLSLPYMAGQLTARSCVTGSRPRLSASASLLMVFLPPLHPQLLLSPEPPPPPPPSSPPPPEKRGVKRNEKKPEEGGVGGGRREEGRGEEDDDEEEIDDIEMVKKKKKRRRRK